MFQAHCCSSHLIPVPTAAWNQELQPPRWKSKPADNVYEFIRAKLMTVARKQTLRELKNASVNDIFAAYFIH